MQKYNAHVKAIRSEKTLRGTSNDLVMEVEDLNEESELILDADTKKRG